MGTRHRGETNETMRVPLRAAMVQALAFGSERLAWQSLNVAAIRALGKVARRPSLMVPHVRVRSVADIPYADLKARGFKALVFDKDATLTLPYADNAPPSSRVAIEAARAAFGDGRVVILSNSIGTPGYEVEAARCEAALGLPVVVHRTKKPGGADDLRAFVGGGGEAAGGPLIAPATPIALHEMIMVGDRLLTDVVFGNLHGMLTVHTQPLLACRPAVASAASPSSPSSSSDERASTDRADAAAPTKRDNPVAAVARRVEAALLRAGRAGLVGRRRWWEPPAHALYRTVGQEE